MCGIFGCLNVKEPQDRLLRLMADQQVHRGPDDVGYHTDGAFGFGLRRLSIIDLKTGHQPIFNEDRSVAVVCNGEIYNFKELAEELRQKGHRFQTSSDVECIVHLYEEIGPDFLKRLNGMFGLALYDAKRKILLLARDRLGIKPLYYARPRGGFLFASELRSLLATGLVSRELDWDGVSLFLEDMYIPTPFTPFKDISKLRAGHYLRIDAAMRAEEIPYWKVEDRPAMPIPKTEKAAEEQILFLLRDSARLEINADVPICAFLSGGVDSSAVVAFAAMAASRPLRTFHVYFRSAARKMDERGFAAAVSKRYGTMHSEVEVDQRDFVRLMPKVLWHLEEPFGDLAAIPTLIISQMAGKEARVCLNGSGGDELFAGYPHHRVFDPKRLASAALDGVGLGAPLRRLLRRPRLAGLCPELFPAYKASRERPAVGSSRWPGGDRLNAILAKDIRGYLQSNVLFLLDKVAMAASMEGRVPLLDHRLVELAAHLPSRWKHKGAVRKYILKKTLEPFLPREVLYREKEGFGAPLDNWLTPEVSGLVSRIVENGSLKKAGILRLRPDGLRSLRSWDLWKVCCLELWYRMFVEFSAAAPASSLEDFAR
jgi:asparagine synthase (glutamine-hydrolysing)